MRSAQLLDSHSNRALKNKVLFTKKCAYEKQREAQKKNVKREREEETNRKQDQPAA